MTKQPILTIVITNYNHGRYLSKAIDSLIEQQFFPFEIVIIDDASTDNSVEVIDGYAKRYSFIRAIHHKSNQGVCFSLCEGVENAHGSYIHTMGADDYRLPGFLKKTMTLLLENPHIGIGCSDFGYIKGEENSGEICSDKLIDGVQEPMVFNSKEIIRIFQTTHFWIPGHTAILKKTLALKYKKYNPHLKFLCDWFLLHQIALNEGAIYIPETLSVWWIHSNSYSSNLLDNQKNKKETYRSTLRLLFQAENEQTRGLFMKSTLLHVMLKALYGEIFYKPVYWPFLFYIGRKSLYWHAKKIKKRPF